MSYLHVLYIQAKEIAKKVTGKNNESEAIKEFRSKLDSPDNFFNKDPFPDNESDAQAHVRCSTIEGAKKYCPMRWKALQEWFKEARMVSLFVYFCQTQTYRWRETATQT